AGLVYCREVDDELLSMETMFLLDQLAPDVDPGLLAGVKRFGDTPTMATEVPWGLSAKESAALLLAKAASTSPASVSEITVAAVHPTLAPDEIVELVVWLSLLQTLHRLYSYLEVAVLDDGDVLRPARSADAPPPSHRSAPSPDPYGVDRAAG
ncbi:MAG: hypothetical protein AAF547_17925, partial [Actinomycetota bacterium]